MFGSVTVVLSRVPAHQSHNPRENTTVTEPNPVYYEIMFTQSERVIERNKSDAHPVRKDRVRVDRYFDIDRLMKWTD